MYLFVMQLLFQVTMQLVPDSPPHLVKSHSGLVTDNSEAFKAYMFFSRNAATAEQEIKKAMGGK